MSRRPAYRQNRRVPPKAPGASSVSPIAISGLVQWLVGDTGASASAWTDQSTGGHSGAQPTAGKQPTVVAASLNGHSIVQFSGAQGMPSGAWQVATSGMSFFLVVRITTLGTAVIMAKALGSTDWEVTGLGSGIVYWAVSSGAGTKAQSNAAIDGGTAHTLIGTYDSSLGSNQTLLWVDGALQTVKGTFAGPIPFGSDQVAMGCYSSAADAEIANLTGDIAEGGIYSRAINSTEVSQLQSYLKTKYGTP